MNLKKMMMASALLMAACCMQAQTKVIAHRGFWKTPGSSQNSISSLLKADSIGCYGSEFDVWIAKDNKLVVVFPLVPVIPITRVPSWRR